MGFVEPVVLTGQQWVSLEPLTEDHVQLLWRMTDAPILCFDGDAAGQRAAFRSIDRALPKVAPGRTLRFAALPDKLDPDDLIKRDGVKAMEALLARPSSLLDVLWEHERDAAPLATPEVISKGFADSKGFWTGWYAQSTAIFWNTERLAKDFTPKGISPPKTWEDLLKPEYAGQIVTADTRTSSMGVVLLATQIFRSNEDKAWEFIRALNKNIKLYTPSATLTHWPWVITRTPHCGSSAR